MKFMKTLADILASNDQSEELYTSDQRKRQYRAKKGYYSRQKGVFSFIHLIKSWEDIVGNFMAANTIPLKIKNKNLIVSTKHPIFAQELGFLTPEIIEKIKNQFPELGDHINGIKYIHTGIFEEQKEEAETPKEKKSLHPHSPEYKQRQRKAEELTEGIDDPEIKAAIKKFMLS